MLEVLEQNLVKVCLLLEDPDSVVQVPAPLPLQHQLLGQLQPLLRHVRLDLRLLDLGLLHLKGVLG